MPFIYFSILLSYIIYKRKRFEISAYVVMLYLISAFFSILIDVNHLRSFETEHYQIGMVSTFLYCFLLTLTIWPFYQFRSERINTIRLTKTKSFDITVYFFFICFILILVPSINSIGTIIKGNLGDLRKAVSNGEYFGQIPSGFFKPFFILANIFGGFSIIMLLFYFYSIVYLNKAKWFNFLILLSSMSIIIIAIMGIDRSKVIYWMITYGFMLVLFWRKMNKKQHKNVVFISILTLSVPLAYFLSVTLSRYINSDVGAQTGLISYAGQSFINFCYFFDNVEYHEFSLQRIFPLFYNLFVHNGIINSSQLNDVIGLKTGKFIGVFSTFIGDIMVASGKLAVILYCFIFYIISRMVLTKKNKVSIRFYQLVLLFCFISVPMLGLFAHFYNTLERTVPFIIFVFYSLSLKFRVK